MKLQKRKDLLISLGHKLKEKLNDEMINQLCSKVYDQNPWFTADFVKLSLTSISNNFLNEDKLNNWLIRYDINEPKNSKSIGLTLAGNIPLVGFHDIVCTFITGHRSIIKMSSKDKILLPYIFDLMIEIDPDAKQYFELADKHFKDFDAIIATGSDNSARYFEYYFGKYPNIIRKNRNSIAILSGNETENDLITLSDDIFMFFGLGCRSVSKLLIPENYNFKLLFDSMEKYQYLINHNKYYNNYIYSKSIMMVNQDEFEDNGFILLKESDENSSPLGMLYYKFYKTQNEIDEYLQKNKDKLQVIISSNRESINTTNFGQSQYPDLWDYADNIDVIKFLISLNN